ncbi:MAG: hypothetical protein UW07_C0055G0003 [Candidatus Nomurabacteria bacterium GW2011_GWF2_43_8]|uniref:Uncharacterized protein n=1 Tax=Candidatus Nomurabacteria bacterium GW2011_GWF2_43_8 TaxID=1618779 RepID=A0A0G1FHF6_9BACT|nr:MAG: hypothetical protein UW07_C0055G0003 [Candidatus Nomurabacteria bacterium GW2011_GWF2_43_8]
MLYLVEHIFLSHKLRKLVGREKFLDTGLERALVDDLNRHGGIDIDNRHPILDISLNLHHAGAYFLLEYFPDKTHAPLAQMVYIVGFGKRSAVQKNNMGNYCH